MRNKLIGLALAVAAASPAAAVQTVTITSTGIYDPGHVTADIAGTTRNEYSVPLTFTVETAKKAAFDALGFCIDMPHYIYVAVGSQLKQTLNYHVGQLTSDGYGNALSSDQVHQITGLASLGFTIAKGNAADKSAQLAGIQQAIWEVEYPTATLTATGDFAAAQSSYAAAFLKQAPTLTGSAKVIFADDGKTQGQITNIGGVPEPTSWAMMLGGFGVVGALARRRRETLVTVAA